MGREAHAPGDAYVPVQIEVDQASRCVLLFARGNVDDAEAREAVAHLRKVATQREDFDFLADASGVEGWPVSTTTIRSLANDGPVFGPHSRRAYVLPSLIAYGLGRMYAAFAYGDAARVRMFRTRTDALEWLGEPGPGVSRTGDPSPR